MPLFIVNASTAGIFANAPYMARFGFTSGQVAVPLAQWAYEDGIRSVFNLLTDYGPGIDAGTQFTKAFEAAGGKIQGEVRVPLLSQDYSSYVARVKDAKADAVFVFLGAGPEPGRFLKAADAIGLRQAGTRIIAGGSVLEQDQLDEIGAPTLGIVSTYHYSMVHDSTLNRKFVSDFQAVAGPSLRPNFAAIQGYDALAAAYRVIAAQNGNVDPDKTMELVKHLTFESPRGPIAIDPATRDIVQNIYVRRVVKRGNLYVNEEFETFPMVKDPVEH
jgi:branched-chain amino acid transport system substrate-binding protein